MKYVSVDERQIGDLQVAFDGVEEGLADGVFFQGQLGCVQVEEDRQVVFGVSSDESLVFL
jgi:hypothetical protein